MRTACPATAAGDAGETFRVVAVGDGDHLLGVSRIGRPEHVRPPGRVGDDERRRASASPLAALGSASWPVAACRSVTPGVAEVGDPAAGANRFFRYRPMQWTQWGGLEVSDDVRLVRPRAARATVNEGARQPDRVRGRTGEPSRAPQLRVRNTIDRRLGRDAAAELVVHRLQAAFEEATTTGCQPKRGRCAQSPSMRGTTRSPPRAGSGSVTSRTYERCHDPRWVLRLFLR